MSFNVRTSSAADGEDAWPKRKEFVAETIRAYDPDLLGTQEVRPDQYDFLVEKMPDYTPVGVGRDDGKRKGEFSLILVRKSRFSVIDSGTFWLSEKPDEAGSKSWDTAITRVCSYAVLKDNVTNREFLFANTHFDHKGVQARLHSGELLRDKLPVLAEGRPIILTGDFNCHETDAPYRALTTGERKLLDSYRVVNPTVAPDEASFGGFKGTTKGRRIDFIFHTPDVRATAAAIDRTKNAGGRYPSDHYPVTATLEIGQK
jgi:endonuclease/exonuclease/phosphatase family metal-dependent hydrolase